MRRSAKIVRPRTPESPLTNSTRQPGNRSCHVYPIMASAPDCKAPGSGAAVGDGVGSGTAVAVGSGDSVGDSTGDSVAVGSATGTG